MKVLCVNLGDPQTSRSAWLTLDQEYLLLALLAVPGRRIKFRVLSDDGRTPILADSRMFAAPIQRLPESWVATVTQDGVVELGPAPWLESGFWERYFDRDPEAVATFQREVGLLGE